MAKIIKLAGVIIIFSLVLMAGCSPEPPQPTTLLPSETTSVPPVSNTVEISNNSSTPSPTSLTPTIKITPIEELIAWEDTHITPETPLSIENEIIIKILSSLEKPR
jgi:hypothetical protein